MATGDTLAGEFDHIMDADNAGGVGSAVIVFSDAENDSEASADGDARGSKRKRDDDDEATASGSAQSKADKGAKRAKLKDDDTPRSKPGKKKKKKRRRVGDGGAIKTASGLDVQAAAASGTPEEQSEILWRLYCDHFEGSSYEQASVLDPSIFAAERIVNKEAVNVDLTERERSNPESAFVNTIKSVFGRKWEKRLCKAPQEGELYGAPVMLVVCGSGKRAADVFKWLTRAFVRNRAPRVAKLFAKHFKQIAQERYLREHIIRAAVGTPNRIAKLIEAGALQLDELRLIVFDMGKNAKQMTLLDVRETRADTMALARLFKQSGCVGPEAKTNIVLL